MRKIYFTFKYDIRFAFEPRRLSDKHLNILACFPNLVNLRLSFMNSKFNLNGFEKVAGVWTQLQELTAPGCEISDENLALVISNMNRVKRLVVPGADFGPLALAALRPHFPHLKELNMSLSAINMGAATVEILASCSQLQSLTADRVAGWRVREGEEWACQQSLKSLEVCFVLSRPNPKYRQQQLIFERISELRNLERLDISNRKIPDRDLRYTLDFRLGRGLGVLKTLKALREFHFEYTKQWMETEEVEWMLENWPQLEVVMGPLNVDNDIDARLKSLFCDNYIDAY
ncbi:hypothetical protein BGZ80_005800 [Entomortierella chlamydospora]|uniref:F-box domain protein n=1 Tax=Entomortierella chlamydospora TaxID=101097 RepID=A0A9P6MJ57_9FUNG|nr:hypothetical protein BGZ80_005800 [Entomortierella chlamydospora]